MKIKMKNPPLDQTEGQREGDLTRKPSQPMNQLIRRVGQQVLLEQKKEESLGSVHERLTTLVNIMDRNNVHPIPVEIKTKFLNCLQPEWSK
ncbi:hypothetical protein Tco_0136929 [Tanacetum coccineum]